MTKMAYGKRAAEAYLYLSDGREPQLHNLLMAGFFPAARARPKGSHDNPTSRRMGDQFKKLATTADAVTWAWLDLFPLSTSGRAKHFLQGAVETVFRGTSTDLRRKIVDRWASRLEEAIDE
jgi:hypothetical protein